MISYRDKQSAKLKKRFTRHKVLIQNFSYLSILQIFNLLLPLVTYPYLIRVLGSETYGLVLFAQAIVAYLVVLVNFGFNLSATKDVSLNRENKVKLSEVVSSILILKGLLFFISLFLIGFLIWIVPQAKEYWQLYLLSMYMCFYEFIFPLWYFQGIEQMKYITFLNLISRSLFLILIFIFIHQPEDYLSLPIINGIGALVAGLFALYIVFYKHKINLFVPTTKVLVFYFKESIPFFVSNLSGQIYVKANKIIIGAFLGMTEVAFYDLAEKIVSVLKMPQRIFSQAIYPKISHDKNRNFIKRALIYSMIINISMFLLIAVFAKNISLIVGGNTMIESANILRILSISIPIVALNSYYVVQLLLPFGFQKNYMRISLESVIIYTLVVVGLIMTDNMGLCQIAILIVLIEVYVSLRAFNECKRNYLI